MSKLMLTNTTSQAAWFSPNLAVGRGNGAWLLSPGVSQCPPYSMTPGEIEAIVAAGIPSAFTYEIVED